MRRTLILTSALALALSAGLPAMAAPEAATPKIDVVFALDTTGSMGGMIDAAKKKIWSIANLLATAKPTPEIRIGLVDYKDRGDAYVTKLTPLSADLDAINTVLMAMSASGGGDTPESVNQALDDAVNKMAWDTDPNTYRVIFLVGDASPHMDYNDDVKYPVTCKLASERGININTILVGGDKDAERHWREIATLAKSTMAAIDAGGGARTPTTPYDSKLVALSMDLEGTRLYYGTAAELAAGEARATDMSRTFAASDATTLADRASFMAGSGTKVEGVRDLVSDVMDGTVTLADLKDAQLPAFLRAMTPADREAYVRDLVAQRREVTVLINDLAARRQAHLLELLKGMGGGKAGVDFIIFVAIKEQAAAKAIVY